MTLNSSVVSRNFSMDAGGSGAGIYNIGTMTILNSTISSNALSDGGQGGGIYNEGSVNVSNSTLSGNEAPLGAAINQVFDATATATFKSSTLANNVGENAVRRTAGTLSFVNSIVYNPSADADCDGTIASNGNNLDEDATCFSQPSDLHGNPNLGPLLSNGGATANHALALGSIAIDKGDNADCTTPTDQRGAGNPRIVGGDAAIGKRCDIGAYEFRQACRGLIATQVGNNLANTINGGNGNDVIRGNGGADILKGAAGNDTLCGDDGNDLLEGGNGQDRAEGGPDMDTASFPGATPRIINLATGEVSGETPAQDLFGVERARGSDANDDITGSAGPNRLEGMKGNDILKGGGANDQLLGAEGVDTFNGGPGNDTCNGGAGTDVSPPVSCETVISIP